MKICQAEKADFGELMEFYDYMCSVLAEKDFLPNGNKGGFPSAEMVEKAINEHNQFIGVEDGKIIATYISDSSCDEAYLSAPWKSDAAEGEYVVLHALRVSPEYSGRGYGKMLTKHAIEQARKNNYKAIRLDVIVGNTIPEKMFKGFGFSFIDTVEMCYEDIGQTVKFSLMELVL